MPFASRGGARLYYEIHGEGPPAVFAHGAGGNTLIWWQQVRHFAASHRVVLFDHRGFGRSSCASADFDARHFPDDLLAILDAAKIDRAAIVGQSMGGFTALRFAVRHPGRLRALVLAGTAGGADTPLVQEDRQRIMARMAATPRLERVLAQDFLRREPERSELYAQISALNCAETTEAALRTLWNDPVSLPQLSALQLPVLLLAGTQDWFFRPQTLAQDGIGPFRFTTPLFRFPETPITVRQPPVALGEHNEYVYREVIGVSEAEYERYRELGHVRTDFDPKAPQGAI